ncbi:hypothetical protein KIW84_UN0793 [Lathyrus oleraceus]|nr:hypothetical protein KIW84_UN0793 [Pisum sativum]
MIGRADIEGSKSNVAMNAWLPQASYPCGNFSDTLASNSEAPTYPTPLKSFHKVGLESSSTGSSFPLIPPSPFLGCGFAG